MPENFDVRKTVAKASTLADLRHATQVLKERYESYWKGDKVWTEPEHDKPDISLLTHPHFLCQPYIRPPKKHHLSEADTISTENLHDELDEPEPGKRRKLVIPESLQAKLEPGVHYSMKKLKKMAKKPLKNWDAERIVHVPCTNTCTNPQGQKCEYQMCRPCCKIKCFQEELDCMGHRIMTKTVRLKARERDAAALISSSGKAAGDGNAKASDNSMDTSTEKSSKVAS